MVQMNTTHAESARFVQRTVERLAAGLQDLKGSGGVQADSLDAFRMYLMHLQHERISLYQVPGVARQFSSDIADYPGRTEKGYPCVAGKEQPHQSVEPHEMIDMGVRDEHVRELENLSRGETIQPAEVELHRGSLPTQPDMQARISEWAIHQPW